MGVEANLRIARGLDYYTGTVVEIFMAGYERLKSVGGGGRYDALADDGRTTYPGVGVSFGVSRTILPLLADGVLAGSRPVPSAVLVARHRRGVPSRQRARSPRGCAPAASPARWPPAAQKFGKQIRFAERRGIPYVWFLSTDQGRARGQGHPQRRPDAADPDTWTPPAEDLRPQHRHPPKEQQ